jgi:hypothetical protein
MSMRSDITDAILDLKEASQRMQEVLNRGTYKINEMEEIRRLLLRTVRNNIDPYALGHAPDKRHY